MSRIFLVLLLVFGAAAHAKEFYATILSWDQLQRLTPEKRATYLREYRKVLSLMEDQQRRYGIYEASNPHEETFSEKVAFLLNYFVIVPSAEAGHVLDDNAPTTVPPKPQAGTQVATAPAASVQSSANMVALMPEWKNNAWSCASSGGYNFRFDPDLGTCAMVTPANTTWNFANQCPYMDVSKNFEGTVAVPAKQGGGTVSCVPLSSYNALSEARRDQILKKQFLPSDAFKGANEANTKDMVRGNADNALADNAAMNKKYGPQNVQNGKADAPKTGPDPIGSDTCEAPKSKTCPKVDDNDSDIEKFRTDSKGDNVCIVAGSFSQYDNPDPRKEVGKCHVPTQFPDPLKEGEEPVIKYDKPGYALCNPFLFCATGMDGKLKFHWEPVTKSNNNVTERCGKWLDAFSGDGVATPANGKGKKRNPAGTEKGKTCDPTSKDFTDQMKSANIEVKNAKGQKTTVNVGEAWDEEREKFKKVFNKRCLASQTSESGKGFQKLFCNECQVIAKALYKMNHDAIGYGCTEKVADKPAPATAVAAPASASPWSGGNQAVPFTNTTPATH